MKYNKQSDERGIAHIGVLLVGVLVLVGIGFAGWRVIHKDKAPSSPSQAIKQAAATCDYDDKDLCKFMASWKENKYYKISAVTNSNDGDSSYTYEAVGTDKYHIIANGSMSYEMIGIGTTTYTKDATDGKWWKQTLKTEQQKDFSLSDDLQFNESTNSEKEGAKTTYKKLLQEQCGNLTCLKYQVINPSKTNTTEYIWFDTKDYRLRRTVSQGKEEKTTMLFSYEQVTINEPTSVKDLGPNQVVVPGSSEPMTMPSEEELNQMMQGLNL